MRLLERCQRLPDKPFGMPVAVVVLAVAMLQPTARRLRLMGWSLVAANLCSLIAVVTTLKIIQDFEAVEPTLPFPMF